MLNRLIRAAAMTIAVMAVAACGDDSAVAPAPVGNGTLTIEPTPTVYEADAVVMRAVYRNASGTVVPDAAVAWSVSDTLRVMQGANGYLLALRNGVVRVTAASNGLTATTDLTILRAPVVGVAVLLSSSSINVGDVLVPGVRVDGPQGRVLTGRTVTITSDNPNVASIDAAGRIHAVGAGRANIRAATEGVAGSTPITVSVDPTALVLSRLDGNTIPRLMSADSVTYDGRREYHEVYLESGVLRLQGSPVRYIVEMKYAQYNVTYVNGQRLLQLRYISTERDNGLVTYDARGDLQLTSEAIYPLTHTATAVANGMEMTYRIPGTDEYMHLFFRREPQ